MSKPSVADAVPIVQSLYRHSPVGCCWHLVLDDGNVDRSSVEFCVRWTNEHDCTLVECRQLADILPKMSRTQLRKLRHSWRRDEPGKLT